MRLSNESLDIDCYPEHGFVIGAVRPQSTRRNILWNPRGSSFRTLPAAELGSAGVDSIESFDRDILVGGWFPMFPTAGSPGESPHHWMHGEAPRLSWIVQSRSETHLTCRLQTPSSGFDIERSVRLTGATITVTTTATNSSPTTQSITFGEHPCFARDAFSGGRLHANPKSAHVTSLADPLNATLLERVDFLWPTAPLADGGTVDLSTIPAEPDGRHDHISVSGLDGIELRGPKLAVTLAWDPYSMPYALIWQHFQPLGSRWAGDVFAIEPASAPGRTFAEAEAVGATAAIEAGASVSTWMTLHVNEVG